MISRRSPAGPGPSMAPLVRALLACGLAAARAQGATKSTNIKLHTGITREEKWKSVGHKGVTLWMTGLSGSGKSTISVLLEHALVERQQKPYFVYRLDGDNLRFGLNSDLGFSPEDRKENVRRVAEVAKLFAEAGAIVVAGLISPYQADRDFARKIHDDASLPFMEVYIDAPLSVVEGRDPKGLYKKARAGKIKGFTGIDAPYEAPDKPEIHVRSDQNTIVESVNQILEKLDLEGVHLPQTFRPLTEESGTCAPPKAVNL